MGRGHASVCRLQSKQRRTFPLDDGEKNRVLLPIDNSHEPLPPDAYTERQREIRQCPCHYSALSTRFEGRRRTLTAAWKPPLLSAACSSLTKKLLDSNLAAVHHWVIGGQL